MKLDLIFFIHKNLLKIDIRLKYKAEIIFLEKPKVKSHSWPWKWFYGCDTMNPKNKHEQMRLQQTKKFLHCKGSKWKMTLMIEENIYKQSIWQEVDIKNIKGMQWLCKKKTKQKHYFKLKNMQRTWMEQFFKIYIQKTMI